jgi:predicted O-linked N-acetylglucosamine transferase (SPINDLY family)
MATLSKALAVAFEHYQAGRLDLAEEICRRILAVEPNHADALHLLGMIALRSGELAVAIDFVDRAVAFQPANADFQHNLGVALALAGKIAEAVEAFQRALTLVADYPGAHTNLGHALAMLQRFDEAFTCFRHAVQLREDDASAHFGLGGALAGQGNLQEAVASYRRALELKPDYAEAYHNLGNTLRDLGRLDEALACHQRAVHLAPRLPEAHFNLGNVLADQGKRDEAAASYRRALELKPNYAEACHNLGTVLQDQGKLDEARAWYERDLHLRPHRHQAHFSLGNVSLDQGLLDEAVACYERAMQLKPDSAEIHSSLLATLQYRAGVTARELIDAHAQYQRVHAAPLRTTWKPHENSRDPQRVLRLGFVSPDFGQHPVGYFLIRPLEHLDRRQCEVFCYSNRLSSDAMTARFKAAATQWRDVAGSSDEQLAGQVRADGIDLLFDLAGHTAKNRLLVFARKPAPVQVTWLGYAGTTGLEAIDYLVADRWEVPEASEPNYCEKVLRLPDGYVCYEPPPYAPETSPLPAIGQGYVTFGSFNNPSKITPPLIGLWTQILRRVPKARLILNYSGLDDLAVTRRYRTTFAAGGIEADRVELSGWVPHQELLGEYRWVDIALDSFPYSGGLTTCEALWMGVPVVTCPGETFASRHSLSHLSTVGLTETVAKTPQQYVDLAVALANDLPRLALMRTRLRPQMAASPLCDGRRFAENLLSLLRGVWRSWCDGQHQEW